MPSVHTVYELFDVRFSVERFSIIIGGEKLKSNGEVTVLSRMYIRTECTHASGPFIMHEYVGVV